MSTILQKFPLLQLSNLVRKNPLLLNMALRCIPNRIKRIRIPGIGPFDIHLKKNRSFWLRDPLMLEAFPMNFLKHLINPGDVVFDIGSNIGLYMRFELECFNAGKVVAFEPMADNFKLLKRNIQLSSNPESVMSLPFAIADFDGKADFQVDDVQTATASLDIVTNGQASLGRRQLGLEPLIQKVQCHKLDTLISQDKIPAPDVIKIDVEGAELLVLKGAVDSIKKYKPDFMIELHGKEVARDVCLFLIDLGYHIGGCCNYQYKHVDLDTINNTQDVYSIHFIMAVSDKSKLPDSINLLDTKAL